MPLSSCKHDFSKTERGKWMKSCMSSLQPNFIALSNFGLNPSTGNLSVCLFIGVHVNIIVAACSDHGYNDQSVAAIKITWNRSPVSKHIENPPVIVINISLVENGFDEMTPQITRTKTMKRNTISPRNSASPSCFKKNSPVPC
ncbi:hypothetical protein AVEN_245476-1 [Araneus ventricosus]|uniref:Uncharacterized protein n=1 Tax=Araneus ventricosus TaxID=182803 RepID=A0A4Y2D7L7_ARAVE|nr:hypothetical protein AVEN_245476-1 [Araneus ventricosus]